MDDQRSACKNGRLKIFGEKLDRWHIFGEKLDGRQTFGKNWKGDKLLGKNWKGGEFLWKNWTGDKLLGRNWTGHKLLGKNWIIAAQFFYKQTWIMRCKCLNANCVINLSFSWTYPTLFSLTTTKTSYDYHQRSQKYAHHIYQPLIHLIYRLIYR